MIGHIPKSYFPTTFRDFATVRAVEEAVVNALVVNQDMEGRDGHKSYAITREFIESKFKKT